MSAAMTEEEARQKWCPFARVLLDRMGGPTTVNRLFNAPAEDTLCLGSDCMAWRWKLSPSMVQRERDNCVRRGQESRQAEIVESGYCGLAGKP